MGRDEVEKGNMETILMCVACRAKLEFKIQKLWKDEIDSGVWKVWVTEV